MTPLIEVLDRACPGFVPGKYDDSPYMWMGSFVRHMARARLDGRTAEVAKVFEVIETTIQPARPGHKLDDESNLAVVGFLEDMQNGNLHPEGSSSEDFIGYLGPKSLVHWKALNGFWHAVEQNKSKPT